MIAELNGKISKKGTNLIETLEDNLTGNFFGSLRYIPFSKGIKKILLKILNEKDFDKYELEEWAEKVEFWPYDRQGELDLVIDLNLVTIAIEVKYNSGLSSDDDVSNDDKNKEASRNQLARESRIIKQVAEARCKKPILLFIARENEGREIFSKVIERNIIEQGVSFKFISWEDIYSIVEEIYKSVELNYFEKIIIGDIYSLLVRKGFNSFKNFNSVMDNKEVIKENYYLFKDNEEKISLVDNKENFNFTNNIYIKEDGYYEFV